jgi:uncharacterized protein (TIGR02217 family)
VVVNPGGFESRNQKWSNQRASYEVGQVNRSAEETEILVAFFSAVAKGRTNGFRFRDIADFETTGENEPLGVGTGAEATYQLMRRYSLAGQVYDRVITKPVEGTVLVYVDTVLTAATVDHTRGLVTMTAPAGAVLGASFAFDVPCRFDTDQLRLERVSHNSYSWPSIILRETRDFL